MSFSIFKKKKEKVTIENFIKATEQWHKDRNLIEGSTDKDQVLKLMQELGELSDSVCKGKDIRDDTHMLVVINTVRNNVTLESVTFAYGDIKDRKGRMVDGVFVKEADDGN